MYTVVPGQSNDEVATLMAPGVIVYVTGELPNGTPLKVTARPKLPVWWVK